MIGRVVSFDTLPQPLVVMLFDEFAPYMVCLTVLQLRLDDARRDRYWQRVRNASRVQFGQFVERWGR